jgi:hypothetical protein
MADRRLGIPNIIQREIGAYHFNSIFSLINNTRPKEGRKWKGDSFPEDLSDTALDTSVCKRVYGSEYRDSNPARQLEFIFPLRSSTELSKKISIAVPPLFPDSPRVLSG